MIAQIAVGVLIGFVGYAYLAIRPPPSRICGSPEGPPVTSPRVKLRDGRHLAYKERGAAREDAKYKIIVCHGYDDSKDFNLPVSEEFLKERQIYVLSFDRAGYGESDRNPSRNVKTEAFDIQDLADKLQLGPKFYLIGISVGAYGAYSSLKYIPHRLLGTALVVPLVNYWWPCFPSQLSKEGLKTLFVQEQWTFWIAHHAPWILHWWMTQKWFKSSNIMAGDIKIFSPPDLEIIKRPAETPTNYREKLRQQGIYECLIRDMRIGFSNWGFDPTDISNPFPNGEGSVHMWQGSEDKLVPRILNRYISQQLPWIQYHEVADAGHLLIYNTTFCEDILKALVSP